MILLLAGIAWVVGYAVQDRASIVGIVTTAPVRRLRWPAKPAYRRLTGEDWQDIPTTIADLNEATVAEGQPREEYERVVTLMQAGTAVGPCLLVSAILLLGKWWWGQRADVDLALAVSTVLLGLLLILLGWVKAAQRSKLLQIRAGSP